MLRVQVIIPNLMGLVIYQPDLNKNNVSPKAEAFCRMLAKQFRVNIFDRFVSDKAGIGAMRKGVSSTTLPKHAHRMNANFFKLCMAVYDGNLDMVRGRIGWGLGFPGLQHFALCGAACCLLGPTCVLCTLDWNDVPWCQRLSVPR